MIKDIINGFKKDKASVKGYIKDKLKAINSLDSKINSFITVSNEAYIDEQLKNIDKADPSRLALYGIPLAFKDIFSTKGMKTTAASKIISDYIPAYSATSVLKVLDQGAINLGKLNSDAFAHGSTGVNTDYDYIKNPYDLTRSAGGSSSGSAASVAAGFVDVAFATDTGGSIRNPSSWCNLVGIKPTYGRVSRFGVISMASSLDSIGHITKTIEDSAAVLNISAGFDANDGTSSKLGIDDYTIDIGKSVKDIIIGIPEEYLNENIDKEILNSFNETVKIYESQGAKIVKIRLPSTDYALAAYYVICPSEISSNLARFDGVRYGFDRDNFGMEAKRRIMIGTYTLSAGFYDAYYGKALKVRNLIIDEFKEVFKNVDVIMSPVTPCMPPKVGANIDDPLQDYLIDVLTVPVNLAGLPALSVPAGFSKDGLPIGIQLIGNYFSEKLLYQIGYVLQEQTKCYKVLPNI